MSKFLTCHVASPSSLLCASSLVHVATPYAATWQTTQSCGSFTGKRATWNYVAGRETATWRSERMPAGMVGVLYGAAPGPGTGEPEVRADGLLVEELVTMETNIDDMSSELLSYVMEQLMKSGALDVWTIGAIMKKGRPGHILHVLCRQDLADSLLRLILRETTTLGVRVSGCERVSLQRVMESSHTPWGWVPVKAAYMEGQLVTMHAEYEDCAALARRHNVPLKVVIDTAHKSFLDSERKEPKALGFK